MQLDVLVVGPSGVGKTAYIYRQCAHEFKYEHHQPGTPFSMTCKWAVEPTFVCTCGRKPDEDVDCTCPEPNYGALMPEVRINFHEAREYYDRPEWDGIISMCDNQAPLVTLPEGVTAPVVEVFNKVDLPRRRHTNALLFSVKSCYHLERPIATIIKERTQQIWQRMGIAPRDRAPKC